MDFDYSTGIRGIASSAPRTNSLIYAVLYMSGCMVVALPHTENVGRGCIKGTHSVSVGRAKRSEGQS